jgi:hypothetical protein
VKWKTGAGKIQKQWATPEICSHRLMLFFSETIKIKQHEIFSLLFYNIISH